MNHIRKELETTTIGSFDTTLTPEHAEMLLKLINNGRFEGAFSYTPQLFSHFHKLNLTIGRRVVSNGWILDAFEKLFELLGKFSIEGLVRIIGPEGENVRIVEVTKRKKINEGKEYNHIEIFESQKKNYSNHDDYGNLMWTETKDLPSILPPIFCEKKEG